MKKISVFQSLPARLSVYISCVFLVAVLLGISSLAYLWLSGLSKALHSNSVTTAERTASRIDRVLAQIEQSATLFATMIEKRPETKESVQETMRTFLETANRGCPELVSGSVAYADGALVPGQRLNMISGILDDRGNYTPDVCDDSNDSCDYQQREWYLASAALEKPFWTTPYKPEVVVGHKFVVSYVVPFFRPSSDPNANAGREVAGVVIVDADVTAFYPYLPLPKNLTPGSDELAEKCGVFLTTQFGRFIVAPGDAVEREATLFTVCDEPDKPNPVDRVAARELFFGPKRSGEIALKEAPLLESASDVYYARCVNGWVVGIAIPSDWVAIVLRPLIWKIALATLCALALVVAIVFVVCRRLNRPLETLAVATEAVGGGDFSAPLPIVVRDDEVGRVAQAFEKMRVDLQKYIAELASSVAARERTEGELNAAKAIQRDLLPHILPPFEEFENVRGAADLIPARGVGGDLYDVFPIDSDRLAFIVGDVSGKGVPASLFMAVTQTLQRSVATTESSPGRLTTRLNEMLSVNNESSMFVTYWIGVLNIRTGLLKFCCGGHNPPVLKRADGNAEFVKLRHGPPLGIDPEYRYGEDELQLNDGDSIVLYTDGVTEAFDGAGDMFGEKRLLECVRRANAESPKEMLNDVESAVAAFVAGAPQSDDLTTLIVQLRADAPSLKSKT